jgi:hypothetical protein
MCSSGNDTANFHLDPTPCRNSNTASSALISTPQLPFLEKNPQLSVLVKCSIFLLKHLYILRYLHCIFDTFCSQTLHFVTREELKNRYAFLLSATFAFSFPWLHCLCRIIFRAVISRISMIEHVSCVTL